MENVGIVRNLDLLGRIVLPKQFRDDLGWNEKTPLAIFSDGHSITIRREAEGCMFCGHEEHIVYWENKPVCAKCILHLRQQK